MQSIECPISTRSDQPQAESLQHDASSPGTLCPSPFGWISGKVAGSGATSTLERRFSGQHPRKPDKTALYIALVVRNSLRSRRLSSVGASMTLTFPWLYNTSLTPPRSQPPRDVRRDVLRNNCRGVEVIFFNPSLTLMPLQNLASISLKCRPLT